ncbi:MAG: integrase arm-type DNA-binding domain-containing protein [Methylotenera sp.]
MKRNVLSAKQVVSAAVGEHRDGAGLCLVVTAASKTWLQRYSVAGKRSSVTLGKYPAMSLADARAAGERVRQTVAKGIPAKIALNESGTVTFKDAIDLWLPAYESKVEEKTKDDALRRMELHCKDIMLMAVQEIKPRHIIKAMDHLVKKGQLETVTKTTDNIKQVMEHARILELIEYNPAIGLKSVFPQHQVQSFPALAPDQLPRIFKAAINGTMTRQTKDLMMFQILSGLRCSEVVAAKWSGIDGDVITIEKEFMKGKRFKKQEHDVFLTPISRDLLERQPKTSEFIFPFRGDITRHANSETITKWLRENGFAGQHVTHGFRSMFSTWANSQKQADGVTRLYQKDVIELCIAHKQANVQTIYDRNEYAEDRKHIMEGWSLFVKNCYVKALAESGI